MDSGNGFGTRVFWTAVIPDNDVQINPRAGTIEMHVKDLPEFNYYSPSGFAGNVSLGPQWQTAWLPARVSFDVVWNGPVTRVVNVHDSTYGFAGTFLENQATVSWSGSNALGFSYISNVGNFSTSLPEVPGVNGVTQPLNFFAQVGVEQNGVFFPAGPAQAGTHAADISSLAAPTTAGASALDSASLVRVLSVSTPASAATGLTAVPPPRAEAHAATPFGKDQATGPAPVPDRLTGAALPRVLDQVFADLDGGVLADGLRGDPVPAWAV